MSSGAKVVTAYVKQTNKDTVPSTGWKVLPNISNGLTVTTELTESEMLDGGRVKKAGMVTSAEVSGDVESELMYGAFDDLIAAAFWSEWNTRAKPHTLQIGSTKTQFALTKDFTDINVNHIFKGCVVSKFTLSVDTSSLVKISFGLTGLGYEESTTRSFATNPTATPDTKKASGLSIGEIKVDGRNIGVCVESITFELDNQTEVQRCLGDNMYGGNILAMLANASGSMKIAYSPEAHNIIKTLPIIVIGLCVGDTGAKNVATQAHDATRWTANLPTTQYRNVVGYWLLPFAIWRKCRIAFWGLSC